MNRRAKQQTIVFLILAAAVSVIIAASLPRLTLEPGIPLPEFTSDKDSAIMFEHNSIIGVTSARKVLLIKILFTILTAAAFLFPVYLIYKYIRCVEHLEWKTFRLILVKIAAGIFVIIGFSLAVYYTISISPHPFPNGIQVRPLQKSGYTPSGSVMTALLWITGILLAGLAVLVASRIITSKKASGKTSMLIELEARKAKADLENGCAFHDVITRCYFQMSAALKREQGIERIDSMTTGEFECLLNAAGAPPESVRELTHLFEAVRYGNREPRPDDESRAIRCFEEIVLHFSREKGDADHGNQ